VHLLLLLRGGGLLGGLHTTAHVVHRYKDLAWHCIAQTHTTSKHTNKRTNEKLNKRTKN
jgi:hypothetical protein